MLRLPPAAVRSMSPLKTGFINFRINFGMSERHAGTPPLNPGVITFITFAAAAAC